MSGCLRADDVVLTPALTLAQVSPFRLPRGHVIGRVSQTPSFLPVVRVREQEVPATSSVVAREDCSDVSLRLSPS